MDRFKRECEQLLEPGEGVLLEANAILKLGLGLWRLQGVGRAFLTNRRLIWLHMAPRPLLSLLFWYNRRIEIRIDQIQRFHVQFLGEVLIVSTVEEHYEFRIAERYWALINPFAVSKHRSAANEWGKRLQEMTPAIHD